MVVILSVVFSGAGGEEEEEEEEEDAVVIVDDDDDDDDDDDGRLVGRLQQAGMMDKLRSVIRKWFPHKRPSERGSVTGFSTISVMAKKLLVIS